jgi:hypothetical protein
MGLSLDFGAPFEFYPFQHHTGESVIRSSKCSGVAGQQPMLPDIATILFPKSQPWLRQRKWQAVKAALVTGVIIVLAVIFIMLVIQGGAPGRSSLGSSGAAPLSDLPLKH